MISYADAVAGFTIGIMGSTHCVVMCGGIASAISIGIKPGQTNRLSRIVAFQLGRILSYALIGLLLGGLLAYASGGFKPLSIALRLIAGLLLIAMGLYVADWWRGLARLERVGVPLWARLQPYTRKLLPVRTLSSAVMLGGLWGWLPCGLVYSTLSWSISAGSPLEASTRMLFFGLGTLPAMLGMSVAADSCRRVLQARTTKHIAGLLLIAYGVWTLVTPLQQLAGPNSHPPAHTHQH